MWICGKCHEKHDDAFAVCWKCGTSEDGTEDPTFSHADDLADRVPVVDRMNQEVAVVTTPERARSLPGQRSLEQLLFVGLNGYAVALDRDTGEIVWSNNEMHSGYVTMLLDEDRLVVSTNGYLYCLDPLSGRILWHNRMSGYGVGTPTALVSVRGQAPANVIQQAAEIESSRSDT